MVRTYRILPIAPFLTLLALVLPGGTPGVGSAEAPGDPEREERLEVGKLAFRDNCLMCHAEEMTSRLRLSEKQWASELDKMIGWGAPVPPELKGPLLDYLVSRYAGPDAVPLAAPERVTLSEAAAFIQPEATRPIHGNVGQGATLYTTHCATCHGPEARGGDLGTCLVEKPVLLRSTDYAEVVRKGRRRMPGFAAALKPEQEAEILAWLRSRRFEAPTP